MVVIPAQAGIQSPRFYKPELFRYINPFHPVLAYFLPYEAKKLRVDASVSPTTA